MRLCYQVATPDVAVDPSVTAYQGTLEKSFGDLSAFGYDGVELMTLNPGKLNWDHVQKLAADQGLCIGLVCTGEVFGQLHLSYSDPDARIRREAVERVKEIIEFAGYLHAKINIGRVRGQYRNDVPREQTEEWAVEAFRSISDYAAPLRVRIALESVTALQTNFLNTMGEVQRLTALTDRPNFRGMMDVFHMNIEERNLFDAIQLYAPLNIHVHLADNNRRYPGNCGLDFEAIISAFHSCGYDELFCTEIFQEPSMEESARRSIEHLAPIFHKVYGRPLKR